MSTKYTTPDTYSHPRTLRTTLPIPLWDGACIPTNVWETGVFLTAVYWQPRARRLIIRTISTWINPRTGRTIGETFREVDPSEFRRIALHHWSIEEQLYKVGLKTQILNSI
jgi:hypothetical protein